MARFLNLLPYVLSSKRYSKVVKLLAPILEKTDINLPTVEEFHVIANARPHNHQTFFSTLWCSHNECLPSDTRLGIANFFQVYVIAILVTIITQIPARFRKEKKFRQLIDSSLTTSSARFALSVSSYFVIYKILFRFFTRVFDPLLGPRNNSDINDVACSPLVPPFLAGLFAGPSLLFDKDQPRRIFISTSILCKSLQTIYYTLRQNGVIPIMPWWWGSWLIFPISSAQLIYTYLVHPDVFPDNYSKFITSRSTTYVQQRPSDLPESSPWPSGREIVDQIAIIASLNYPHFHSPKLHGINDPALPDTLKPIQPILEIAHPAHTKMLCAVLHPEDLSCLSTYSKFIAKEGITALKFMTFVHLISLFYKSRDLVKRFNVASIQILSRAIPPIFKGATFITMAIATAWALLCGFQKILPNKFMPVTRIYANGFIAGLWILVENPSRRLDIGLYSLRLSIESFWKLLVKNGKARNVRNGEVIYFSFAMACIMAIYKTQPNNITPLYMRETIKKLLNEP
ncbi:19049_t:CDS:2 [Gigaspora margarita]|uniref:19049_t:CDS:1 n=1 Tax=Gigaspora margarita TaxID=4874 RepID=A0ABN7UX81_GIGMA|nr:19049_t:CDS:2 [Gigaspora margarita]